MPIPEAEAGKLFMPYSRLPGAAPGGDGLGLAIVKEISDQNAALDCIARKADGQATVAEVSMVAL